MIQTIVFVILVSVLGSLYMRTVQKERQEPITDNIIRPSKFEVGLFYAATLLGFGLSVAFLIIILLGNQDAIGNLIFGLCVFVLSAVSTLRVKQCKIIIGETDITIGYFFKSQKTYPIEEIDEMVLDLQQSIKLYSKGKKITAIGITSQGYKLIYDTFKEKLTRNEYEEVMNDVPEDDE